MSKKAAPDTLPISIKDITKCRTDQVPDDDVARLMYYLHCVDTRLRIHSLDPDLVAWKNYDTLPAVRIAAVFQAAFNLHPDKLVGRFIFPFDDFMITLRRHGRSHAFFSIGVPSKNQQTPVTCPCGKGCPTLDVVDVMLFEPSWLEKNYYQPVKKIEYALRGVHCDHCKGSSITGICSCPNSCKCQPGAGCAPKWAFVVMVLVLFLSYRGLRSFF